MSKLNISFIILLLIFAIILGVVLTNPIQLKPLFNENKLVENATAIGYLITIFLLLYKFNPKSQTPNRYFLPLLIYSVFVFLEEINYGIPFFATPPMVAHKELDNLHNLIEIFLRLDWYRSGQFYSIITPLILLPLIYMFQGKTNKPHLVVVTILVNSLLGVYTLLIFFIVPYKKLWVNHIQPAIFSEVFILTLFIFMAAFLLYGLKKSTFRNTLFNSLDRLNQNLRSRKLLLRMLTFGLLFGAVGVLIYPMISSLWFYYLYYVWTLPILYYCATILFSWLLLILGWERPISKQLTDLFAKAKSLVLDHQAYKIFIVSLIILLSAQTLDLELIKVQSNVIIEEYLELTASMGMIFSALAAKIEIKAR